MGRPAVDVLPGIFGGILISLGGVLGDLVFALVLSLPMPAMIVAYGTSPGLGSRSTS